ncbi:MULTISPECIES: GNAT family N-acetyltransferase [unclassified Endozoicomonas]|uniref:GNAT family N-acetyltransferase n=1 Tax=unclassified Endozoicomonas TaxID=2644528 RepID=UPI003BB7CC9A
MLNGKNIKLRVIREQDIDQLAELSGNIESLGEYLPTLMVSAADLRKELHKSGFLSESLSKFIIADKHENIIGSTWAFKSVPYFDALEVGYHIFSKEDRGKGFATEALLLLTNYLFQSKQVNRIELRISTKNIASEKVAKNVGFVHEGTNREAAFSMGKLHDMHIYALIRSEWLANHASS